MIANFFVISFLIIGVAYVLISWNEFKHNRENIKRVESEFDKLEAEFDKLEESYLDLSRKVSIQISRQSRPSVVAKIRPVHISESKLWEKEREEIQNEK